MMVFNGLKQVVLVVGLLGSLLLGAYSSAEAMGLLYTNTEYPLLVTGARARSGIEALKKGEASTVNVLFLFEFGDAGLDRITKQSGITKVHFVDVHERTLFLFFRKQTVKVYGE
jgi:hypothetical protein